MSTKQLHITNILGIQANVIGYERFCGYTKKELAEIKQRVPYKSEEQRRAEIPKAMERWEKSAWSNYSY